MPVTSKLARFGIFELDLNTGELSKNGRKLKLQEQPFRILNLLLEQPGQPITRDRLKEVLWPSDTFVDFDHSLNAAIAKLRQALGDSAENPRFVETLARRGYRFIAPVEITGNGQSKAIEATRPGGAPTVTERPDVPVGPPIKPNVVTSRVLGVGIAGLAIAIAVGIWFWRTPPPGQPELVQLTNDTGLTMDPAVSPDGKLLAYASDAGDGSNLNIWIQQLGEGGSAVQLTHWESDTSQPSFSPDGTKIVFRSAQNGGGIYVIPSVGGEPVRVAPDGRDPSFSPDGKWIAYWRGGYESAFVTGFQGGDVYVVPTAGGHERLIGSDLKQGAATPVWAPDSKRLLVLGWSRGSSDCWVIYLDGKPSLRTGIFSALRQQGFVFFFDRAPHLSAWANGFILFSARYRDAYNAWRLPVSDGGHSTGRAAERLTAGTTLEVSPVLTANGSLIFASLNLVHSIWGISADADHGLLKGDLKKITDGRFELMPSISRDGRTVAFAATKKGAMARRPRQIDIPLMFPSAQHPFTLEIRAKNVETGGEAAISRGEPFPPRSEISPDGSMLAYTADRTIYMARVDRSSPPTALKADKPLFVWDCGPDNKQLLFSKPGNPKIYSLDAASGRESLLLSSADYALYQAKFSPDARAVAVMGCVDPQECRIFIVPLKADGTSQTDNWIAIDHPSFWDDKPRWSPNGNLLYFVSDRDGHLCLWAQRLDGSTKRPVGTPFPVYHFHNSRLAMINIGVMVVETGIARDKIVMGVGELTGNVWSLKR